MFKDIKYMANMNRKYTNNKNYWCCHSRGYTSDLCGCKRNRYSGNLAIEDNSWSSCSSGSETMIGKPADLVRHNSGQTNRVHIDTKDNCETCKTFYESAKLHCCHVIPHVVADANTANLLHGTLKKQPVFTNIKYISYILHTGANLVGIRKGLVKYEY